ENSMLPVAKVCRVAKLGVVAPGAVVLSSTETPASLFVTIRSGLPLSLMSAVVTEYGTLPTAKVCWGAKLRAGALRGLVLISRGMLLAGAFATIRSGLPSPLTSAAVTEYGTLPTAKVCGGE